MPLRPHAGDFVVRAFVDSDWGTGPGRKSVSGGCISIAGCFISSWSRTQSVVAQSSAEAELYAAGTGASEALFGYQCLVELRSDSAAAVQCLRRAGLSNSRIKHIELRFLALKGLLADGRLKVSKTKGREKPGKSFYQALAISYVFENFVRL